jgi:hypothetical protein
MAHETYQDLEIEIICFETEDVIISSDDVPLPDDVPYPDVRP